MGGLFVSFEGIDRAGKTTQARLLCDALGPRALAVREPGGTPAGESLRELLKDPVGELDVRTETLLFAAARAELVARVIAPALAEGRIVICDRFVDSSLAYQGAGRQLGMARVAEVNQFATAGVMPDLTLLLRLDPSGAHARAGSPDRFEAEGVALQREVDAAYELLAREEPERFRVISAERSPEAVHADVMLEVETALTAVAR